MCDKMRLFAIALFLAVVPVVLGQDVIDLHCHLLTPDFRSSLEGEGRLMEEGFPLPQYDVRSHLRWMNEVGVATLVLTLAAPHPSDPSAIRRANEAAAEIKREYVGRFLFCASLPLPDVDLAISEARYALDVLHADGIKLATNIGGQYLGAPELDRLFEVLDERHALVILHPHCPNPVNSAVMHQTPLAMQEYLSETTRAVANMISRNVLARYPNVKVVVPHCGAYLPLALPRMKGLAPAMQANGMVDEIDWEANLASLYFDLAGAHSPEVIRMMLTITTPDHLLYGSDYPYVSPQPLVASLERMRSYLADEPDLAPFRDMILYKNAQWLLGLSRTKPSTPAQDNHTIVRLAEIEVLPEYIDKYMDYSREVERLSVSLEPDVICLFPMQDPQRPTHIRILEIYASDEAYQKHLQTDHFKQYKSSTGYMVKSLDLPTLQPTDPSIMQSLFRKMHCIGQDDAAAIGV